MTLTTSRRTVLKGLAALGALSTTNRYWGNALAAGTGNILVVVNLNPREARAGRIGFPPEAFGLQLAGQYEARELLTGQTWTWSDHDFVRLDAFHEPVHILHVKESR